MSCYSYKVDGVTLIGCSRNRPRKPIPCASCSVKLGNLLCDGCDKGLCPHCSTAPTDKLDFCPTCARGLFVEWCGSPEGKRWASGATALKLEPQAHRDLRRNAFRKWAKENAARFEQLRSGQSVKVHPR